MKKTKGKSRLKAHKRKQALKKLTITSGFLVFSLWLAVFYSIDLFNKNQSAKTIVIQKTIIKEVKAKNQYIPSQNTITLINRNSGLSAKIKAVFEDDWLIASEIIARESSFNNYAINQSSGACGLAQALPCSKMACSLDDIECQLKWIKSYINNRYGSVKKALNHHNAVNWY